MAHTTPASAHEPSFWETVADRGLSGLHTAAGVVGTAADWYHDATGSEGAEVVSHGAGLVGGVAETAHGALEIHEGHTAEGAQEVVSGAVSTGTSFAELGGFGALGHGLVEAVGGSSVLEGAGHALGGVTRAGVGLHEIAEGDVTHGVQDTLHGGYDAYAGVDETGMLGPASSMTHAVVDTVLDAQAEGSERNVEMGTFGRHDDGSGVSSVEFALGAGADTYHGLHDYLADGAEAGSARELGAEVVGGLGAGLAGGAAGLIGLGGDLIADTGFMHEGDAPILDRAWSWLTE